MMGPIKGEMSMAPIMTAVELTFQTDRSDQNSKDQNPEVGSADPHSLADRLLDYMVFRLIMMQIKKIQKSAFHDPLHNLL